jgi:hypothetical protein
MNKKPLLILLCLPIISFRQITYVPDDSFCSKSSPQPTCEEGVVEVKK